MLTLKELKKIVKVADVEKRIPSVKSLKEHKVVVKEMIISNPFPGCFLQRNSAA